jgi:hypothetical protein
VAGIVTKSSGYTEGDARVLELSFFEGAIAGDNAVVGGRGKTQRGDRGGDALCDLFGIVRQCSVRPYLHKAT